jgi:hypothetical protein
VVIIPHLPGGGLNEYHLVGPDRGAFHGERSDKARTNRDNNGGAVG